MLLKTAFKNLKKSPVMNIVCLLQLTAIFLITAVMVSSLCVRYRKYLPVKDILELNGIFCEYPYVVGARLPDNDGASDATFEELRDYTGAQNVFGAKSVNAMPCTPDGEMLSGETMSITVLYNDAFINSYIPKLSRGRWIDPASDELEAVIPEGLYGANEGDVIDMSFDGEPVKVRIVGVFNSGGEYLCLTSPRDKHDHPKTYRSLYDSFDVKNDDGNPPMLLSESALQRLYPKVRTMIVCAVFDFGETDAGLSEGLKKAAQTGCVNAAELQKINAASREYIRAELMKLLPIVVVLMVLTVVSAVSVSAIAARRRLRDYAKYYVLGLRWRQCALVNLFQTLITGAAALVIAATAVTVIGATPLSETFMVTANGWVLLAVIAVFALYLIFSMIMPLIMLNSATPKELLQAE